MLDHCDSATARSRWIRSFSSSVMLNPVSEMFPTGSCGGALRDAVAVEPLRGCGGRRGSTSRRERGRLLGFLRRQALEPQLLEPAKRKAP